MTTNLQFKVSVQAEVLRENRNQATYLFTNLSVDIGLNTCN